MRQHAFRSACSALAVASSAAVCASPPSPFRQIAGLTLISALTFALWFTHRRRFEAIVPAIGLTLVFLILAGLALAAVHVLSTVPVALASAAATLAAAWAGVSQDPDRPAESRARFKPPRPAHLLAATGAVIFVAATVLAVRYAADGATTDADGASSVAIWAYPSGDQLDIGVEQPAGHGAASLRIVVTQAGATVATWNDIHLAAGQTWEAPALTVSGNGPAQVVALDGETVVASLSSR
jgi:hypothetical protein